MGSPSEESRVAEFLIFLDENHCGNPRLLEALRAAEVSYISHLDLFPRGVADVIWLPEVGRNGWCLLTTDKKILYHPLERESVREHQIRMFYFATNNISGLEMGKALTKALPAMRMLFDLVKPPFTASISRKGEVALRDHFGRRS